MNFWGLIPLRGNQGPQLIDGHGTPCAPMQHSIVEGLAGSVRYGEPEADHSDEVAGAFTCESAKDGLACEDQSGNGFFFKRDDYEGFAGRTTTALRATAHVGLVDADRSPNRLALTLQLLEYHSRSRWAWSHVQYQRPGDRSDPVQFG